jgi:hypothetical protein
MSEVNDRLTEQKNDQEKLMNNLTVLTDDLTDTIKDLESKNDQKLGQINQDMNDLNGAMKMRVKVLADDLNDNIKDLQSKNETSLEGDFLI